MAFLVLEWDDADLEDLEGGASGDYGRASGPGGQSADVPADADSARHPRTAGPRQRHRPEVVGGAAAAAGDCCAGETGEFGALRICCLEPTLATPQT